MFKITSNAYANTGDGPAVLARRGVPMEDIEFFRFHPTGIKGMGILIYEAVRAGRAGCSTTVSKSVSWRPTPPLCSTSPPGTWSPGRS